jgi:thiamine biosynthesis lipoprotein
VRWFLILLSLFWQGESLAQWTNLEDAIMGTRVQVQLWDSDPQQGRSLAESVLTEFRRIDRMMSPYREESELSLLNREAMLHPIVISNELFSLLEKSQEISKLTAGAFDITYASVGYSYNYREGISPSAEWLQANLTNIDYRNIELDSSNHSVKFRQPGVRIDLGGIAKGYAVDRGIALLAKQGIEHALITAGGDSRLLGDHQGRPWQIGIRSPRNPEGMVAMLPLVNEAISTSGDYERYFESDGVRYHHILNPKTGRSASEVQSVTIIGPNATRTDALSTSVFVLGVKAGLALVNRLEDIESVIIDQQGRMHYSDGLQELQH